MKKWIKILLTTFLFGSIAAFLLFHFFGASMVVYPMRVEMQEDFIKKSIGEAANQVNIYGADSIMLDAYHIKNPNNTRGTFIICHGVGSCKEHQINLVDWFNQFGFNTFLFDGRAHGKSEGEFCTYGYYEKEDISRIVNYLEDEGETPFIMGTSLGGAIALQALAYEPRLKGGLVFSTFCTLREIALAYQKRMTSLGWSWTNDYTLARAEKLANFKVDSVQPVMSCEKIQQPVFISHGKKDVHIDYGCAQRNFDALNSNEKELFLVEDADHNNLFDKGGVELNSAVSNFIRENF